MKLELTADQQALAESVREFLDSECPTSLVRSVVEGSEGAAKAVDDLWARMVELDWPALTVPESDGGIGLGQVELTVVAEQLGRSLCPAPLFATAAQYVPMVLCTADGGQRGNLLGAVAAGEVVGTLALAEAGGRPDLDTVKTSWERAGDGYRLSGTKHVVFDAARADEMAVVARHEGSAGDEGIGVFVVAASDPAVTVVPEELLDASRQMGTVHFDAVTVPVTRALGSPGDMGGAVQRAVDQATAAMAAEMVGTSQAIFDIVHGYVGEREQFGVKIGSFQAVKHKLANMFVALQSAKAIAYFAAATIDEDDERRELAVWMAKSSAGDCQKLMAQEGIQNLGGIGYTWEHDMHMFVKRQKVQAALFGTGTEHRDRIASRIGLSRTPTA